MGHLQSRRQQEVHVKSHDHMTRIRVGKPPIDKWRCPDCGKRGTWKQMEPKTCTADLPPCTSCGQTPECAHDCPFMMALLGSSAVTLVTDDLDLKARVEQAKRRGGKS